MAGCYWRFGLDAITLGFCYARRAFLFFLIIPLAKAHSQDFSFDYNFRNAADVKQLNLVGNVSVSNSGIKLAVDSNNGGSGSVGLITSPQHLHIWNKTSNELKGFATHFSFMINSNEISHGDGLAFFLANPNHLNVNTMDETKRGGLGIGRVPETFVYLSVPLNQFVAVEFDTFSNTWDPVDTHVGVNVNSMKSEIVENWGSNTTASGGHYECTIKYKSEDYCLNVSFTGSMLNEKRVTQYLLFHIDLRDYLPEWVTVGIAAATGDGFDEHTLLSWSFNKKTSNDKKNELDKTMLLAGVGVGLGGAVSFFALLLFILRKRGAGQKEEATSETASDLKMDGEFQMGTGPKKINYELLVSATDNFQERHKLGQGGFGCVYKGYFKDLNSYAAIKRISAASSQGLKQYATEVRIISQLRHRNLVKFIGWCHKKNDLFLIYEYMPNGSLFSHLFRGESILAWNVRYNIALGLASALFYLQEEWEKCVLHRDIKSCNIMLDSNFNAKLGDFGLARVVVDSEKGSQTTIADEKMGYLAPEYISTGKARKESDMFSFGVVLLEVASGRKAIDQKDKEGQVSLVEWVWELYRFRNLLAAADPNLNGEFDVQQMECLLVVGLWSANSDSNTRPSIRQVIKVLNFEAPFPILPHHLSHDQL
ncbi:unnamed protein product [Sphenostylis stenocarpa]|uniref:non-specific serine/threonine protein kinase n=1 Tax=Sphenostylis stenocarpa TaxID=92480 RepID=A0AA86VGA0_9FABA|nr:unnamed protein product [Sphenostylis stenocarpa]